MDRILGVITLVLMVTLCSAVSNDLYEDCDVIRLNRIEITMRRPLDNFSDSKIKNFTATPEELAETCSIYEEWDTEMDDLLPDCGYSPSVQSYTYQNHHTTKEVYEFVCDSQSEFHQHKVCLSMETVQDQLTECTNDFMDTHEKTLNNDEPISYIHDKSCGALEVAIDCVYNASNRMCNTEAADYYEDYFRALMEPKKNVWGCRFDDGWGSIVIVGMLIAVLAIVALVWATFFLCCRYCNNWWRCSCCSCCERSPSGDYDPEVHPMERY